MLPLSAALLSYQAERIPRNLSSVTRSHEDGAQAQAPQQGRHEQRRGHVHALHPGQHDSDVVRLDSGPHGECGREGVHSTYAQIRFAEKPAKLTGSSWFLDSLQVHSVNFLQVQLSQKESNGTMANL